MKVCPCIMICLYMYIILLECLHTYYLCYDMKICLIIKPIIDLRQNSTCHDKLLTLLSNSQYCKQASVCIWYFQFLIHIYNYTNVKCTSVQTCHTFCVNGQGFSLQEARQGWGQDSDIPNISIAHTVLSTTHKCTLPYCSYASIDNG